MQSRTIGAIVGATVLALAVAGPATAAPTRADYIAQADPICAKANAVSKKQLPGFGKDVRAERWGRAIRRFRVTLRAFDREIDSLAELEPPAADVPLISDWLDDLRGQKPRARGVIAALKRRALKLVVRRTNRLVAESRKTKRQVADFGFRDCDDS